MTDRLLGVELETFAKDDFEVKLRRLTVRAQPPHFDIFTGPYGAIDDPEVLRAHARQDIDPGRRNVLLRAADALERAQRDG